MDWPLSNPAVPPPAVTPANNRDNTPADDDDSRRRHRLSGPSKEAREDYHDFIEAVGKAASRQQRPGARPTAAAAAVDDRDNNDDDDDSGAGPVKKKQRARKSVTKHLPVGTTRLYDHGRIRLIPFPSADPKDPLNLPAWRKWAAIVAMSLCRFLCLPAPCSVRPC